MNKKLKTMSEMENKLIETYKFVIKYKQNEINKFMDFIHKSKPTIDKNEINKMNDFVKIELYFEN